MVDDPHDQDEAVRALVRLFPDARLFDRHQNPSYGYRAVHLVVPAHKKLVEVQVRTALQHLWAQVSEKLSDIVDPAVKYGGGPDSIAQLLADESRLVASVESERTKTPLTAEIEEATHALIERLKKLVSSPTL